MTVTFRWRMQVRTYETDRYGDVQDAYYLHYLQETATRASASAGYPMDWYMRERRLWIIQKLQVRYGLPARVDDELDMTSWVSDFRRVRSHREYDVRRVSDGAQILRARANWVYIDMDTLMPTRLPPHFEQDFGPHTAPLDDLSVSLDGLRREAESFTFTDDYLARATDIDRAGHVNNGVYPRWIDAAVQAAVWQAGGEGLCLRLRGREIDYLKPALERDAVQVRSRVIARDARHLAWEHQIVHAASGDLLVKDLALYAAEDNLPEAFSAAILRGPG